MNPGLVLPRIVPSSGAATTQLSCSNMAEANLEGDLRNHHAGATPYQYAGCAGIRISIPGTWLSNILSLPLSYFSTTSLKQSHMTGADKEQRRGPHPLLTEPTLYAVDVPDKVKWNHLQKCLNVCGEVRSGRRSTTETGRKRWTIHFASLFEAEMALATLQGVPVPNVRPPWVLMLSHSASLDSALPTEPLCAQFVKAGASGGIHGLHLATTQQIFRWFRAAGPLVSVRTNLDVGYSHRTCVLEYWHAEDADFARRRCHGFHATLRKMEPFTLRTIALHSVLASNMGPTFKVSDVQTMFGRFGTIIHSRMVRQGSTDCHCYISFDTRDAAAAAIVELNYSIINGVSIHVRYVEPRKQSDFALEQTSDVRKPPVLSGSHSPSDSAPHVEPQESGEDAARRAKAAEQECRAHEQKLRDAEDALELARAAESAAATRTVEARTEEDIARAAHGRSSGSLCGGACS